MNPKETESREYSLDVPTSIEAREADLLCVNARLTQLLRGVAELVTARTVEAKLKHAANVLTGSDFYTECTIFFEDVSQGLIVIASGQNEVRDFDKQARYEELRSQLEARPFCVVAGDRDDSGQPQQWAVRLKICNHDQRSMGLAELLSDEESLCNPAILEHVAVFMLETVQSVEQFQLERELENNEARYRGLIDNVSDVIFRLDREGHFTFVSKQVKELVGRKWKEILGHSIYEHVVPQHNERVKAALRDIMNGRAVRMDCDMIRADGGIVTVMVSANPTYDDGVISGGLGVARDMTEKRRLEEQIRESEQRYRALTESAYDSIILVDPETGAIVDANPQTEVFTGYSRDELRRMRVYELSVPGHEGDMRNRIASVMESGTGRFADIPLVRKDGRELVVDTAASVCEVGGRRYYQGIVRDISLQKQMNESLQQRVLGLQILTEVSDALQSAVDLPSVMGIVLTGVTAGKGLGFNRAFILSYDKTINEVRGEAGLGPGSAEEAGRIWSDLANKGLSLSEIFDERLRSLPVESEITFEVARRLVVGLDDDRNVFARAIRNREAVYVDRRLEDPYLPNDFLHLYGAEAFAIVPLVTRDDVMGVLMVDNIFTRHKIEEEDLHRLKLFANSAASAIERSRLLVSLERRLHELTLSNQELKISRDRLIQTERLSAIGEVAANVAHEIRNPLTAIGGFARSVYGSLPEGDKNRRKIEVILEETDRLEVMLSSLLEFTRPAVPRFTELDLNALIMQTIHFMGGEIDPNMVQVVYELNPELPKVWADSQQIRQVLLNIVRNAIQEMKKGGILTLSTWIKGDDVQLAIRDTGPGIPPEILEKIFEAFFTTKAAGSGLGLAVCAQIVRNHNGRIEAQSVPGGGAQFLLTLPVARRSLDSF